MTTGAKIRKTILDIVGPIFMAVCCICVFLILLIILAKGLNSMFEFMEVGTKAILDSAIEWFGIIAGISFVIFILIIDSICPKCSGVGIIWWDAKDEDDVCPKCDGSGVAKSNESYPWYP